MEDAWKGENLIRARPTAEDTASETKRLANKFYHNRRRAAGAPAAASKSHSMFVRRALNWTKKLDAPK